ncbi:S41 family peptidase [Pedobacter foliorum]|uniref:S41 family peptidase n=1 Tax=Pedobacter foliorum TaxID=2739058 RepID=UPI0015643B86|nr:S41 family peptidase [Pedobacter foliorum]NRF39471.1 hypothetical protein [Pedobacter foliorum]
MNKIYLTFFMLALTTNIFSQQKNCNCLENLDKVIEKTEINYAGFPSAVTDKTISKYKTLVKKLKKDATGTSNPIACFKIIKAYVSYFNDKHFDFEYAINDDSNKEYHQITEAQFRSTYSKIKPGSVEGIWTNPDSSIKFAIIPKTKNVYQAIIIKSNDVKLPKGLVYSTITKTAKGYTFDKYNWITPDYPVRVRGGLLFLWNFEIWGREYPTPMSSTEKTELSTWKNYNFGLGISKLNDKTTLLRIASFNNDNKIREIITKNDSLIRSSENLIVDLRGNAGGNSGWFYLMPYFYTNPIDQGPSVLRLSEENKKRTLPRIKSFLDNPPTDPSLKKNYTPELIAANKKAYLEIPQSKATFYPIPSMLLTTDSIAKSPRNIALIFDDLGGSSTEFFFYVSRQSKKIKRYGTHTYGMMDYMGMSEETKLPFSEFYLVIPNTKASWTDTAPINGKGFQPETSLNHLPPNKWIDFVAEDLSRNQ